MIYCDTQKEVLSNDGHLFAPISVFSCLKMLAVFILSLISSSMACLSDSDCFPNRKCCNNICTYGDDCFGSSCDFDSDCSHGESCCSSTCRLGNDCLGFSCSSNFDCKTWESCCDGSCTDGDCFPWVIVGSILGVVIFVCLLSLCTCMVRWRLRSMRSPGRVIVGRPVTTVASSAGPGNEIVYPGQAAPSYQQGYTYFPPPQFVQHPPPYTTVTKAPERPPPYTSTPNFESRGVYTPQESYGTVANPSAPVM